MHTQGHHPYSPTLCQCLVGTALVSGLLVPCLFARPGAQQRTREARVSQGANAASAGAEAQVLGCTQGGRDPDAGFSPLLVRGGDGGLWASAVLLRRMAALPDRVPRTPWSVFTGRGRV